MQKDVRTLEFMASDKRLSLEELAVINGALRIKRHQAAVARDEKSKQDAEQRIIDAAAEAEARRAREAFENDIATRSVAAAEASARWAKWSMVLAALALVVAIAALFRPS